MDVTLHALVLLGMPYMSSSSASYSTAGLVPSRSLLPAACSSWPQVVHSGCTVAHPALSLAVMGFGARFGNFHAMRPN